MTATLSAPRSGTVKRRPPARPAAAPIVVIYVVIGVLCESFTHPFTILSGLPAAGLGALLTLLIFDTDLNLYASSA